MIWLAAGAIIAIGLSLHAAHRERAHARRLDAERERFYADIERQAHGEPSRLRAYRPRGDQ